jgi:hydrogenase-1 operon protein HyaE
MMKTVNEHTIEAFLEASEYPMLFFAGNPERHPESHDVAVIVPELLQTFPQLSPALIEETSQEILQHRFAVTTFPTLVLCHFNSPLGKISGIQDWVSYTQQIQTFLGAHADV